MDPGNLFQSSIAFTADCLFQSPSLQALVNITFNVVKYGWNMKKINAWYLGGIVLPKQIIWH